MKFYTICQLKAKIEEVTDIVSLVTKQYENIVMSATQDEYEDNGTGGSFLNPSDMEYSSAAADEFELICCNDTWHLQDSFLKKI